MTISRLRLWILCIAVVAPTAMAATRCPVIRPPGLTSQQVDAVVAGTFAQFVRKPVAGLDTSRTVKALDGTDNATLTYSFATLDVGSKLGFDAVKVFYDAAAAKGAKQPFDSLSIAELQALARTQYAQGKDEPPPAADVDARYVVTGLPVRVPSMPAGDWLLRHCGADDVTFTRRSNSGIVAASVRVTSLSPFFSDADFLREVATGLQAQMPARFKTRPWQPTIVKGTSVPCADAAMNGDEAASGTTLYLRVRICHLSHDNPNAWAVLFSETLAPGQLVDTASGEAFIADTSPK